MAFFMGCALRNFWVIKLNMNRFFLILFVLLSYSSFSQTRLFGLMGNGVCKGDSVQAYSLNGGELHWMGDTSNASNTFWLSPDSSIFLRAQSEVPKGLGLELNPNAGFQNGMQGYRSTYLYPKNPEMVIVDKSLNGGKINNQGDTVISSDSNVLATGIHFFGDIVWESDFKVESDQVYHFGFFIQYLTSTLNNSPGKILEVFVNNVLVYQTREIKHQWQYEEFDWFSHNATSAVVSLRIRNGICFPAPFGWSDQCAFSYLLDDVSFRMRQDSIWPNGMRYDSAWIEVYKDPRVEAFDSDSVVCVNLPYLLTLSSLKEPKWLDSYPDFTRYISETSWYGVEYKTVNGCVQMDSIFVHPRDQVDQNLEREGDYLIAASGFKSYEWSFNDSVLLNVDSNKIRCQNAGWYKVKMKDEYGCDYDQKYYVLRLGFEKFKSLKMYPNPAKENVRIQNLNSNIVQVELIDIYGKRQLLAFEILDQNELLIDLNKLNPGSYFLIISTEENTHQVSLIKK